VLRLSTGMKIFNDIYAINSGIYCRDDREGVVWALVVFLEN